MIDSTNIRRKELELCSSEELDVIVRKELDSDTPDRETVLLALSILEERDPTDSTNRPEDALETWSNAVNRSTHLESQSYKPNRKHRRWLTAVAAAVIALILLAVVPQSVGAESIFEIIGRWTRNIFCFYYGVEDQTRNGFVFKSDHEGLQQIYDAVVEQGITEQVVPTWIPEGYELEELRTFRQHNSIKTYARLIKADDYIQIIIESSKAEISNSYTKDDANVIYYYSAGVCYYLYRNDGTWNAVWNNGNIECFLTITDTDQVLHQIIKSIQKENGNE